MTDPAGKISSSMLMLAWCGWLMVSWLINLAIDPPTELTLLSMIPAVRWMLISALVGMALAWPALRLSQPTPARPSTATVVDLVSLLAILQVVLWAGRLLVNLGVRDAGWIGWTVERVLVLDLAMAAYAAPIGLVVDVGRRAGGAGRTIAMLLCVGLMMGGPLLAVAIGGPVGRFLAPMAVVWQLSDPSLELDLASHIRALLAIAGAAAAAWVAVGAARSVAGRGGG